MAPRKKHVRVSRGKIWQMMYQRLVDALERSPLVMTPKHSHWAAFYEQLDTAVHPKPRKDGRQVSKCVHDHRAVRRVLSRGDYKCDPSLSIAYFQANGGYCDCEVLWNVGADKRAPPVRRRRSKKVAA
jgi:hypothetical protein